MILSIIQVHDHSIIRSFSINHDYSVEKYLGQVTWVGLTLYQGHPLQIRHQHRFVLRNQFVAPELQLKVIKGQPNEPMGVWQYTLLFDYKINISDCMNTLPLLIERVQNRRFSGILILDLDL